jgi:hypothetical protein
VKRAPRVLLPARAVLAALAAALLAAQVPPASARHEHGGAVRQANRDPEPSSHPPRAAARAWDWRRHAPRSGREPRALGRRRLRPARGGLHERFHTFHRELIRRAIERHSDSSRVIRKVRTLTTRWSTGGDPLLSAGIRPGLRFYRRVLGIIRRATWRRARGPGSPPSRDARPPGRPWTPVKPPSASMRSRLPAPADRSLGWGHCADNRRNACKPGMRPRSSRRCCCYCPAFNQRLR